MINCIIVTCVKWGVPANHLIEQNTKTSPIRRRALYLTLNNLRWDVLRTTNKAASTCVRDVTTSKAKVGEVNMPFRIKQNILRF